MKEAKCERVVSHFDNRENSRLSMKTLLAFAQNKMQIGVDAELPLDEIATAKEYFFMWRRRKPFENMAMYSFFLTIATFIFSFTSKISLSLSMLLIVSIWGSYVYLESGKRKIIYIKEMIGDLSNLSRERRDFYLFGLREELWRIKSEEVRRVFAGVTLAVALIAVFLTNSDNSQMKMLGMLMGIMTSMIFYMNEVIKVEKVKV